MSGFFLYTSNRMEHLAGILTEIVSEPRKYAFSPEIIVVQNRGMQRWLTLQLSDRIGIWSHCEYPFPDSFIRTLLVAAFPELAQQAFWEPDILHWRILKLLPQFLEQEPFIELKRYLSDSNPVKLYELSRQIADLFDQYSVYRPEMVMNWEHGQDNHWQSVLWRNLANKEINHIARLKKLFLKKVSQNQIAAGLFPERVMIFGISVLPPCYLEMFEAVSSLIDVHFFLLNPCVEYWDDIFSSREISRQIKKIKKSRKKTVKQELLHIDQGNPLLASFGQAGRDFFSMLHNCAEEISLAVEPEPDLTSSSDTYRATLLESLQSDILHLRNRTEIDQPRQPISPADKSIQIHSCHSPMREVEVLYDNLLNIFESYKDLSPSDIVVMTPDIDLYAPFIEAVFSSYEDKKLKIPFSIADRNFKNESHLSEIFLSMLELSDSRFSLTPILDLLETAEVRSSFNIKAEHLDTIRNWLINAGIRWGIDEISLISLGLPKFSSNTWEAGIQRLLSGYALPSDKEKLFRGIAGFDYIEGTETEILGNFLDYYTTLVDFRELIKKNYSIYQWCELLSASLDRFFKVSPGKEQEIVAIRNSLFELGKNANEAAYSDPVDIRLVRSAFSEKISNLSIKPGFITGGVTFCAMLPMRSIPFKVVCLIGFNEDMFPRKSIYHSWDLIAQAPRTGDRSLQSEDRYLFLETILSARDVWYVSYTGMNSSGDGSRRPSVLVQEVLDYIQKGYCSDNDIQSADSGHVNEILIKAEKPPEMKKHGENVLTPVLPKSCEIIEQIGTSHRLQAFNPSYFDNESRHFSYSQQNFKAASLLHSNYRKKEPFFVRKLDTPARDFYTVSINDLCSFFKNPSSFLLNRRCGISFNDSYEEIPQEEPFYLTGLDSYKISEYLTEKYAAGCSSPMSYEYLKQSGMLPHGSVGECSFEELSLKVKSFVENFKEYQEFEILPDIQINYEYCDIQVIGTLGHLWKNHRIVFRYANTKPSDLLDTWLNHLFLNTVKAPGYPVDSLLFTRDNSLIFNRIDECTETINKLLDLYLEGLCEPLPFFPVCSLKYAESILLNKKTEEEALVTAKRKWYGDEYNLYAEGLDPYNELCFREADPFNEKFAKTALSVFQPLIEQMKNLEK